MRQLLHTFAAMVIKRVLISIVAVLYLSTAVGVGLNFHYCFGRVASVKLYENKPDCKLLKRTKKPRCCQSRQLNVKVKDSHQQAKAAFTLAAIVADRPATGCIMLQSITWIDTVSLTSAYRGPPPGLANALPLFIRNCTFRI